MIFYGFKYKLFVQFSCKKEAVIAHSEGGRVLAEDIFYMRLDQNMT
jgi:hypothetical protein